LTPRPSRPYADRKRAKGPDKERGKPYARDRLRSQGERGTGHVAGQKLAAQQSATHPLVTGINQLAQLNKEGKLTDDEFTKAKGKLLD